MFVDRFTWDVIKRNKLGRAILLTTHSMKEADLLCDKIAIMAEGDLAAVGSSMDLKQRFGVGYCLTVVKQPKAGSDQEQNGGPETRSGGLLCIWINQGDVRMVGVVV